MKHSGGREAKSWIKFFPIIAKFCNKRDKHLAVSQGPLGNRCGIAFYLPTMKPAFLFRAAFAALYLALCSCASVSVREIIPLTEPPTKAPETIFVQPFEFEEDMLRVGRQGKELEQFKSKLQQEMTANLLERIRKYIAPAQPVSAETDAPPGNSWLIGGRFTRVNQGSRLLRGTLGFGTGGTKMDVTATVSDLSGSAPKRFLMIQTTGGTNAMPGAVMGAVTWPMAIAGAPGLVSGLSGDCRRTSREITSALAQYMKKHGLQVSSEVPKPKPKGGLPWLPRREE
jgi:Domain of unknown function (DUF4410)